MAVRWKWKWTPLPEKLVEEKLSLRILWGDWKWKVEKLAKEEKLRGGLEVEGER